MSPMYPFTEELAEEWVKLFRKSPYLTSFTTVIVVALVIAGFTYLDTQDKLKKEKDRLKNQNYESQINQLNETENGVRNLLEFIEVQKTNIRNSEDTLKSLKLKEQALKPVVEASEETVNAILRAQEMRNQNNIWRERLIGFVFGIFASLVASVIGYIIKIYLPKKQKV